MTLERPPIKLFKYAQMIEYNTARTILARYYQLYRDDDNSLSLLPKRGDNPWRKPDEGEPGIIKVFVDNGFFTHTIYYDANNEPTAFVSDFAHDLIEYHDLLIALAKAVNPKFKLKDPNYIGYKRRVNDYANQSIEELSKHPSLFTILN